MADDQLLNKQPAKRPRGRPQAEDEGRTARLDLKTTPSRKERLQAAARARGVPVSTMVDRWIDTGGLDAGLEPGEAAALELLAGRLTAGDLESFMRHIGRGADEARDALSGLVKLRQALAGAGATYEQ